MSTLEILCNIQDTLLKMSEDKHKFSRYDLIQYRAFIRFVADRVQDRIDKIVHTDLNSAIQVIDKESPDAKSLYELADICKYLHLMNRIYVSVGEDETSSQRLVDGIRTVYSIPDCYFCFSCMVYDLQHIVDLCNEAWEEAQSSNHEDAIISHVYDVATSFVTIINDFAFQDVDVVLANKMSALTKNFESYLKHEPSTEFLNGVYCSVEEIKEITNRIRKERGSLNE